MSEHVLFFAAAAIGYSLCGYIFWLYSSSKNVDHFASSSPSQDFRYRDLLVLSIFGLFLEMLMIRWISSEIRIFAYFKNFVLIACFLGFGLGCSLSRRRMFPLATALTLIFLVVLVASPVPGLHNVITNYSTLIGSTSQLQIWGTASTGSSSRDIWKLILAILGVAPVFGALVFGFVPIGQMVGSMLELAPSGVKGYTLNVIGSLIGILLYTALCFFFQPPAIWLLVAAILAAVLFFRRTKPLVIFGGSLLIAAALLILWTKPDPKVFWSPYQKLGLRTGTLPNGDVVWMSLNTNDSWYQWIVNLSPSFIQQHPFLLGPSEDLAWNPYNVPYRFRENPGSVLILGAGMGNDVASAVRNTNAQITAVEIDPLILRLGKLLHFEHPYQSDRVRIVNDDARSYIQNSGERFDMLVFSLLDSHTTASSYSNVRIDNYVYTLEGMQRSRELLKPDGLMIVKFQADTPWIADRLRAVLQKTFQSTVLEAHFGTRYGTQGSFFFAGSEPVIQKILARPELALRVQISPQGTTKVTTDDWPYFYQKARGVPIAVLGMSGFLVLLSYLLVKRMVLREASFLGATWRAHFFFLGAGFMLLEAQIISKMALLFGTTWVVNSIVVSGLLLLIVCANLIYGARQEMAATLPYTGIFAAILLTYFLPLRAMFFPQIGLRILIAGLVLCLPVLFASMVFIRSFAQIKFAGDALGWNLLGAVLGGMLETVSQATGLKSLLIFTALLYLGSWLALERAKRSTEQHAVPAIAEA